MKFKKFSVVIPAYNEEAILANTLLAVDTFFTSLGKSFEIILVNDGSLDNTGLIGKKFLKKFQSLRIISHFPNLGKGYSVRQGILASKGEIILFTDCDLSTSLEAFLSFLPHFDQEADLVIGSRRRKESQILLFQPLTRRLFNWFFYRLVFFLIPLKGITDTNCGFKALTQEAARKIFSLQTVSGWGFDTEVLYIAKALGYKNC